MASVVHSEGAPPSWPVAGLSRGPLDDFLRESEGPVFRVPSGDANIRTDRAQERSHSSDSVELVAVLLLVRDEVETTGDQATQRLLPLRYVRSQEPAPVLKVAEQLSPGRRRIGRRVRLANRVEPRIQFLPPLLLRFERLDERHQVAAGRDRLRQSNNGVLNPREFRLERRLSFGGPVSTERVLSDRERAVVDNSGIRQATYHYTYKYAYRPHVRIYDSGSGTIMNVAGTKARITRIR